MKHNAFIIGLFLLFAVVVLADTSEEHQDCPAPISVIGGIIALGVYLYGKNKPDDSPPIDPQKLMIPQQYTEPQQIEQVERESANGDAFYQVIIDNNIFRPLGWYPQTPKPKNILIGTVIATNTTQDTKAFIVDQQSGQLHSFWIRVRATLSPLYHSLCLCLSWHRSNCDAETGVYSAHPYRCCPAYRRWGGIPRI